MATLKRVWGRIRYDSDPSRTTLDALARFAGFEDWITAEVRLSNGAPDPTPTLVHAPDAAPPPPPVPSPAPTPSRPVNPQVHTVAAARGWGQWRTLALGFAGALLALFLVSTIAQRMGAPYGGPPPEALRFETTQVGTGLPATVQFRYAANGAFDTLVIQQSWDARLRHRVDPERGFHACTYYYPGVYQAKLIADGRALAERPLVVGSNGWLGTIGRGNADPTRPPAYLPADSLRLGGGAVGLPAGARERAGDEAAPEPFALHYVGGLEDASTETGFELSARFVNHGSDPCQRGHLVIHGEASAMVLPLGAPGCSGDFSVYACGQSWRGDEVDLAGFGVSPQTSARYEVTVRDSVLSVWVDGRDAFRQNLGRLPGRIVGLRWEWAEAGAVEALRVGERRVL